MPVETSPLGLVAELRRRQGGMHAGGAVYPAELEVSLDEHTPAMKSRPALLVEPPGQPLLDLVLGKDSPSPDVFAATADALKDVEVVLDVLERGFLGKAVEDPADILLGGGHPIGGYAEPERPTPNPFAV
jgi:hypothetical protein